MKHLQTTHKTIMAPSICHHNNTHEYLNMIHSLSLFHNIMKNNNSVNNIGKVKLHQKKRYICKFCNREFSKGYNLQIHERVHTGERPFPCTVCDKSFKRQDHLRDHMYSHTKQKPHECQNCGKGFSQSRALSIHKLLYSSESLLACPVCPSTFTKKAELKSHMTTHHSNIKPKRLSEIVDSFVNTHDLVCCGQSHHDQDEEQDVDVCSLDTDDSEGSLDTSNSENIYPSSPSPTKFFSSFSIDFLLS